MAELFDSISSIRGIGDKKAQAFARLGVFSLYDLISFFPRNYEDRTSVAAIFSAPAGENVCVSGVVADEPRLTRIRKGMEIVRFKIADESGVADITFFNQSWVKNSFRRGEEYTFYGRIEASGRHRAMANPVFEKAESAGRTTMRIMPVYRLTKGLGQRDIVQSVRTALDSCGDIINEVIPEDIIVSRQLCRAKYAFENIHSPAGWDALEIARRRLIYEELFVLACALGRFRGERTKLTGTPMQLPDMDKFFSSLPFSPTGAQRRAVSEAAADMCSGNVMNRLVQGDVGSGKTLVAAALAYIAYKNGFSTAFMAPTEILAAQHLKTMEGFLSPLGMKTALLTGSMTTKEKREVRSALAAGEVDIIIGTHALFTEDVEYSRLGLVITDEQHRFGVAQRSALIGKGCRPHVLVMSATPIPRTLALILYGDLDVSIIDEMPPGRRKVDTFAVTGIYRQRLNAFILKQTSAGRQVFVVCPMVEENEEGAPGLLSAEEHARNLALELPGLRIGCVHGRMKPKEKDEAMSRFISGETDVLVSTTVIEVGVDVPNASLIIIENAERFGLSQLHQLRGRVGRGKEKSYCVLVSDNDSDEVKARLGIMCKTNDGFRISEEDLRLRGPGDFFGSRQHGLPAMHVADLGADSAILKKAQEDASALLALDADLSLPEHAALKARVEALFRDSSGTFN